MTRMRILIVLVIAVLAGGGLAAGTYRYLQNMPVKEVSMPTKPVVVANADLALGTELHRDDLTVLQVARAWEAMRPAPPAWHEPPAR